MSNQKRQSFEDFRQLLDLSPIGVAIISPESGTRLFVNQRMLELFGVPTKQALLSQKVSKTWVDPEAYADAQKILASGNDLVELEVQRKKSDGTPFWVLLNSQSIEFNGKPARVVWHTDITERKLTEDALRRAHENLEARVAQRTEELTAEVAERKEVEAALRAEEERYRTLTEGSLQGIGIVQDERVAFVNGALAHLLGYEPEEMIGQPVNNFIKTEFRASTAINRAARLRGETPEDHYDIRARHRDGRGIWIDQLAHPVVWNGRAAVQVSAIDITKRKEAETAMIKAIEEAELANRAKTDFLAHMSHELRTPLNSIIGFSQTIGEEVFGPLGNPRYLEYIDDIRKSGYHLLHLINDILDISKIEAGEFELNEAKLDLDNLLQASIRMIKGRKEAASISFRHEGNGDLPTIYGDEHLLRQVVLNLLANAVKYNIPNGTVRLSAAVEPGNGVSITVEDTGIGIDEADIPKVLEPFGQARRDSNRTHEGTGLGLSLSKQLVELHGGELRLVSQLGKGTIVTVTLPSERTITA